jgi:hypothetical protein
VAERPPDRLGTLRECRSAMRAHPSASAHAEGSGSGRCWGVDTGGIPLSPSEPEPHSEHARGASRSLGDRNPNSPVRNLFRSDYFKTNPGRKAGVCRFQPKAEMELRGVANSSPRQSHERRVLLIQITRARLSLCAQRFRGVGEGGWCRGVSGSSPWGRRAPPLADRIGRKSLRVSRRAGCRVKTGSVPLERSLPKV